MKGGTMSTLQADIEARLATAEPQVEVLLAEVVGGETLRLFIDHPDGVTLDLCERVTHQLAEVREQYSLEVSSPGLERPLSKPAHFAASSAAARAFAPARRATATRASRASSSAPRTTR
jgi:ribosome maturation factor RimP